MLADGVNRNAHAMFGKDKRLVRLVGVLSRAKRSKVLGLKRGLCRGEPLRAMVENMVVAKANPRGVQGSEPLRALGWREQVRTTLFLGALDVRQWCFEVKHAQIRGVPNVA